MLSIVLYLFIGKYDLCYVCYISGVKVPHMNQILTCVRQKITINSTLKKDSESVLKKLFIYVYTLTEIGMVIYKMYFFQYLKIGYK